MYTVGIVDLTAEWIPQTFQTIKEKNYKINTHFLIFMAAIGVIINFY